jgi:hypothetical protein
VAGGFALCVALVPSTASAEDEPATPAPAEEVAEVLGGEQGTEQPQDVEDQEGGEEQSADETPEEPPPFEIPPEVITALEEFAAQAGFSEECVTGVTEALERIGNGIAGLPAELEELGTGLAAAAQQSLTDGNPDALTAFLEGLAPIPPEEGSEDPPALPIGGDIAAGLQQLAETLQEECQPTPPGEQPDPTGPPAQPASGPQPPPQNPPAPAPQQPVQQATYPGYAPTGAEEVEDGPSPAAIAIALAALAGGAVWTGRRWGAERH